MELFSTLLGVGLGAGASAGARTLREYRNEAADPADLLNWAYLVDPGVILERPGLRDLYRDALALAPLDALGRHIVFRSEAHGAPYERLVRRLIELGLPDGFAGPAMVAERVDRTLCRRPRLALDASALAIVREWLVDAHAEVHTLGDRLVLEVTDALATR